MTKEWQTVQIDDVRAIKETEKALLVEIENEEFWIPKSVIHDDSEVYAEGHEGSLVIPEWFAKKAGIDY